MTFSQPEPKPAQQTNDTAVDAQPTIRRRSLWPLAVLIAAFVVAGGAWVWAQGGGSQLPGPQPSLGTLTAAPMNFVFNTPTVVTFTIPIPTPTLNPTSVVLQRVAADGTIETAAQMFDTGQNGDAKAGDRVFTARLNLTEPVVGKLSFRVAAAFRGNQPDTVSQPLALDVAPFPLPPDPGEAGKQTLAGIDSDNDGVRDDVQRWIGLENYSVPTTLPVLSSYAALVQRFVVNVFDESAALKARDERVAISDCWDFLMPQDDGRALTRIEILTLNTPSRLRAFADADKLLSGRTFLISLDQPAASACTR
jgi:hypothetical protein